MSENQSQINTTIPNKISTFLADDNISVQIVFIKKNDDAFTSSYMTADDTSLKNIRKMSINFIYKKNKWNEIKYGEDLDNEKTIGVYRTISISEVPKRKHILTKPNAIEPEITQTLIDSTSLIGFRFELPNRKPVMLLKKIDSNYFVLTKHKKFAFTISGVAQLAESNLFRFPDKFDLVTYGNVLLIFNPKMFENFFGFYEIYQTSKNKIFDYLKNNIDYKIEKLDDIDEIIESPSSPRFLRKFRAIEEKEIYKQKCEDLEAVLKIRPTAKVTITDKKFKFEGTQAFVDFYNDNYLFSYFTNRYYTALSKTLG